MHGCRRWTQPSLLTPSAIAPRMVTVALLLITAVLVPVLNLVAPAELGAARPDLHRDACSASTLTYALLAVAVDLIWGYLRHPEPRSWRLLRARRLCHGHVPDARRSASAASTATPSCRTSWCSSTGRSCPGSGTASTSSAFAAADGGAGAGAAGLRLRLARLPLAGHRRLPVDHHPGADLSR